MSDNGKPENIAQTSLQVTAAILEKAPIYDDLAKPSLQEIGQGLGGALKLAMLPLKIMGYAADHFTNLFEKSLEQKASKTPPERLQAPDPVIMGPIIQALGYTAHKEPLREMFTSLLVTAMDSETAFSAHPSFVEIIKNISPDEAKILKRISKMYPLSFKKAFFEPSNEFGNRPQADSPLVNLVIQVDADYIIYRRNIALIVQDSGCEYPHLEGEYLDNLDRLGLVKVKFDTQVTNEIFYSNHYKWFEEIRRNVHEDLKSKLAIQKGILSVTELGRQFIVACVIDKDDA